MHLELMRKPEKELEVFKNPDSFTSARIWHCKYQTLETISDFVNLKTLVIATLPDSNLDFLSSLQSLNYLRILHLPKVSSVSALGKLNALEYLSLSTLPSWDSSGKVTVLNTLAPLAKLNNLKHIELLGVCTETKELKDLEKCTSLISGQFSKYSKNEVKRFVSKMNITQQYIPEPVYE